MKIIERLYQYLDYKGIKPTNFEKQIGLSNGYLSAQKKRLADIGETIILKIIGNCRDISLYWLITGEGDMLIGDRVIFFPPKKTAPQTPPEPTIIYKSDPKDAEIIELQREQIQLLKEKLEDFKKDHIGYVRSTPIPPVAAPASAKVDPLVKVSNLGADQPSKQP